MSKMELEQVRSSNLLRSRHHLAERADFQVEDHNVPSSVHTKAEPSTVANAGSKHISPNVNASCHRLDAVAILS